MERQEIRTLNGTLVGYYEIQANGSKTIRNVHTRILGYYDANRNLTLTPEYRIIAQGDVSGIFFKDDIRF